MNPTGGLNSAAADFNPNSGGPPKFFSSKKQQKQDDDPSFKIERNNSASETVAKPELAKAQSAPVVVQARQPVPEQRQVYQTKEVKPA